MFSTLEPTPIRDTGFSWVPVTIDWLSSTKPAHQTPVTPERHVVLVCETQRLIEGGLLKTLDTNAWSVRYQIGALGFLPFDLKAEFPGRHVSLFADLAKDFDFDAWARRAVDVPPELDVQFIHEKYRREVVVVARTMKKGKITNVRKKIPSGEPFAQAAAPVLAQLRRLAPAPQLDLLAEPVPDHMCGQHLAGLLRHLDETGLALVKSWVRKDLEARANVQRPYEGTGTVIPGPFLIGAKVEKLALETTHKSNAVHAEITLQGGHTLKDDETGTTVTLRAELPETILASFRRRRVGEIVEVPWAEGLTVRTTPTKDSGQIQFRAFSDNVAFSPGPAVVADDAEIERRMRRFFVDGLPQPDGGRKAIWEEVDTSLVPVLGAIDRRQLSIVLAKLELYRQVALDRYGFPGWIIKGQSNRIVVERQPPVKIADTGLVPKPLAKAA